MKNATGKFSINLTYGLYSSYDMVWHGMVWEAPNKRTRTQPLHVNASSLVDNDSVCSSD